MKWSTEPCPGARRLKVCVRTCTYCCIEEFNSSTSRPLTRRLRPIVRHLPGQYKTHVLVAVTHVILYLLRTWSKVEHLQGTTNYSLNKYSKVFTFGGPRQGQRHRQRRRRRQKTNRLIIMSIVFRGCSCKARVSSSHEFYYSVCFALH